MSSFTFPAYFVTPLVTIVSGLKESPYTISLHA
jgi:hypothetical protein